MWKSEASLQELVLTFLRVWAPGIELCCQALQQSLDSLSSLFSHVSVPSPLGSSSGGDFDFGVAVCLW